MSSNSIAAMCCSGLVAIALLWADASSAQPTIDTLPRYNAPTSGTRASARVAGGINRGNHDESLSVTVIAPDHTGLTTLAQPTLYWYASRPIAGTVELTIQDEQATQPLLESKLKLNNQAGLIPVRLSELGVRLSAEHEDRWSIAIVSDANQRSRDVVTSGFVKRVAAGDSVRKRLGNPSGTNHSGTDSSAANPVFALAEEGLWYDALAKLSEQIDQAPRDEQLRRQRAALLEQIGLPVIAEFDRNSSR